MEKNMGKIMEKAYIVIFVILGIVALFYGFTYRVQVTEKSQAGGFVQAEIEDLSDQAFENNGKVRIHLGEISGDGCHLIFYTIHKTVSVFSGPTRIYAMGPAKGNTFSKTPGCVWNDILLTEDMSNTDLIVNLTPAYKGLSHKLPEFYVGTRYSIVNTIVRDQVFMIIICLVLIVMGLAMMSYTIYNRKNTEVDKNLFWLGAFTFYVSCWKILDSSVTKLLFQGMPVFSMMTFVALGMTVIPIVLYLSEMHSSKDSKIWMIPCYFSIGVLYLSLFLQFFGILDLRQMLVWYWATIAVAGVVSVYMVAVEYRLNRWSTKLRRNLFGPIAIFGGAILDLISYFVNGGRNISGWIVFLFMIFILIQGFFIFKESGALIVAADGIQKMENFAFHDKLTGLLNRAAFITDTDPYAVNPDNYAVAVMDLNDLKKCNDTLGHEVGDRYIHDSAKIIQETFGTIGNCYRMGGDEFYCLIPKGGKRACREQESRMEDMIESYNASSPDLKMSIACGFARYDQRMDYDLNATAKRADKAMYQRKEEMKRQRAANQS